MADQERFRPYIGLPSEQERLQAVRGLLDWAYTLYMSRDRFSQDVHIVLGALRMSEGVKWGKVQPTTFVEKLTLEQCVLLQEKVRKRLEELLDPPPGKVIPDLFSPSRVLIKREDGPGKTFYVGAYSATDNMTDDHFLNLILLRFFDALSGLNTEALVRCAICERFTLRRHPRGKTYCSSNCRAKAAVETRRKTQEEQRIGKDNKPVSRRGRQKG